MFEILSLRKRQKQLLLLSNKKNAKVFAVVKNL